MKEKHYDNNIHYDQSGIGLGKAYIGGASRYPPRLDETCTIGACDDDNKSCTNGIILPNSD